MTLNDTGNSYSDKSMQLSIDIFLERMASLVFEEKRPFCHNDFLSFELDGESYRFASGTIRNIFSQLRKKEQIELAYNSGVAFHTLKGVDVGGKTITPNHGEDYLTPKQMAFINSSPTYQPINLVYMMFAYDSN